MFLNQIFGNFYALLCSVIIRRSSLMSLVTLELALRDYNKKNVTVTLGFILRLLFYLAQLLLG